MYCKYAQPPTRTFHRHNYFRGRNAFRVKFPFRVETHFRVKYHLGVETHFRGKAPFRVELSQDKTPFRSETLSRVNSHFRRWNSFRVKFLFRSWKSFRGKHYFVVETILGTTISHFAIVPLPDAEIFRRHSILYRQNRLVILLLATGLLRHWFIFGVAPRRLTNSTVGRNALKGKFADGDEKLSEK